MGDRSADLRACAQILLSALTVIAFPSSKAMRGARGDGVVGSEAIYSLYAMTGQRVLSFVGGRRRVLASAVFCRVFDHFMCICRPLGDREKSPCVR